MNDDKMFDALNVSSNEYLSGRSSKQWKCYECYNEIVKQGGRNRAQKVTCKVINLLNN